MSSGTSDSDKSSNESQSGYEDEENNSSDSDYEEQSINPNKSDPTTKKPRGRTK